MSHTGQGLYYEVPGTMTMKNEVTEPAQVGRASAVDTPLRKRRSRSHQLKDLLHFNALPDRLRDNEYITKYYRVRCCLEGDSNLQATIGETSKS